MFNRLTGLRKSFGFETSIVLICTTFTNGKPISSFSTKASKQPLEDKNSTSGDSIRTRFLEFYEARGHKILPGSSLVSKDPTVLLTIAGMLQFKPIFLGKEPRKVPRATTCQKCIRTNDIENVGHTSRHQTFFEMLGNFSFGDYFKRDAIKWAWELLTVEFGLRPENLWITVYEHDDETYAIWLELGIPAKRIIRLGEEDNFWTSGATGPCGPCSEIYYDFHPEKGDSDVDLGDDTRFLEIYNLVFMQYNKKDDGLLEPLENQNIDTGLGLERMARVMQKVPSTYESDLIYPIVEKAAKLANITYRDANESEKTNLKIICDHMRAIVYSISDGVGPSNTGSGYVVRHLIRRVVRKGRLLGIKSSGLEEAFLPILAKQVIELSSKIDANVKTRESHILDVLKKEEQRFVGTLKRGEKPLERMITDALKQTEPCISGKDAFLLHDTYGFPIEITRDIADERGVRIDMEGFGVELANQRRQSQAAHNTVKLSVENGNELKESVPDTEFPGYNNLSSDSMVESLLLNNKSVEQVGEGNEVEVILDRTPFYPESGGQITDNLMKDAQEARNEVSGARAKAAMYKASSIVSKAIRVGSIKILVENMEDMDGDALKSAGEYLLEALEDPAAVVLGSCPDGKKVRLVAAFSRGVVDDVGIQAGKFIGPIAKLCGGGGGGRSTFAQAVGTEPDKLPAALEKALQELATIVSDK